MCQPAGKVDGTQAQPEIMMADSLHVLSGKPILVVHRRETAMLE
jgi:hypothetical protein